MKMKYFVLYYGDKRQPFGEFYLKGKSMNHIAERVENYQDGALSTNKGTLMTSNIQYGYLLEVNPIEHNLSKRDFGVLNENQSYCLSELGNE
ncbi:hypothetical protein [Niallia sp.]|uniref:hypothetical protein n=1 Tax=Niallia sp. TaxID=2837523 RepID=UPI00289821BD|nr:hypothetical protein [Niallia sp.]